MRLFLALAATSAIGLSSCCGGAVLPSASPGTGGSQGSSPLSLSGAASAPAANAGTSAQTSSQSIPFAPTPDTDPFYAQPASFPNTTPGTIIASRSVTYAPDAASQPNSAWELKFVSRDIHDKPIAAIATVVKPLHPFAGGPEPLLSVQYYTNSLGLQCSPSHAVTGSTVDYPSDAEGSFPLMGLEQGFTLVFPDHLGSESEYAAALPSAHITLEGIRAALAFAPLGLNAKTPVGMEGYSGGSIPTMWGASIARRYAPELNIVAAATGGTVANLKDVLKDFDTGAGNALFSLGLSAMFGVNRAFPSLLTPILNAKGVAAGNSLKNGCVGNTSDGSSNPTGQFADYTTIADPLDNPKVDAILKEDGLPVAGYPAPPMPLYIYQSMLDELVPVNDTDALVTTYCMQRTHVAYYVGVSGEHVAFDVTMAPTVYAYFAARFAGLPEVVPPGTKTCN